MNGINRTSIKSRYRMLSMLICLIMVVSCVSTCEAFAVTDAEKAELQAKSASELKTMTESAKAEYEKYKAAYTAAEQKMSAAQDAASAAYPKIRPAQEAMEAAEWPLDQKSRQFADQLVIDTWNANDRYCFNKSNSAAVNTIAAFRDKGMTYDNAWQFYLSDYRLQECRNNTSLNKIITEFERSYGSGAFDEVLTRALGYNSLMLALEHIDHCNQIRADKTELKRFWEGVKGQSVPDNTDQLRVSPSMMINSAVSAALNSSRSDELSHIYVRGGIGMQNAAQNAQSVKREGGAKIKDALGQLWYGETSRKQCSHNGNIAWPTFNVTGAALSNPNPYTGTAVFSQDFNTIDSCYKTYTTAEYRNRLQNYCRTELNQYNVKKSSYDAAVDARQKALDAISAAGKEKDQARIMKNRTYEWYCACKEAYEKKCQQTTTSAPKYYTVYFSDGMTNKDIKIETVQKGKAATPPTPPVHDGYEFIGWDKSDYKNVNDVLVIRALYRPAAKPAAKPATQAAPLKKPVVKKVIAKKTTVKVTLKAAAKDCRYEYQLRKVGTSKWFSKKSSKSYMNIKNLRKNSKYKIRIRLYRQENGKTKYGPWRTINVKTTKSGSKSY